MKRISDYALWTAIAVVALYVGAGGVGKLAGVPYLHSSFPKLGLPAWFGYFIGVCEVLGPSGLFVRPLRALAAAGIVVIMVGATYYHAVYTPIVHAAPAFVLALLCTYIFLRARRDLLRFGAAQQGAQADVILPHYFGHTVKLLPSQTASVFDVR